MFDKFDEKKSQLDALSKVLNKFNSEAVQLRILDHLFGGADLDEVQTQGSVSRGPRKAAKKTKAKKPKQSSSKGTTSSSNKSKKDGPKGVIEQLIAEGYFAERRSIGDVREYCKINLARNFKTTDLSPAFSRLIKDRVLAREKNSESKSYEYFVR